MFSCSFYIRTLIGVIRYETQYSSYNNYNPHINVRLVIVCGVYDVIESNA